MKTFLAILCLTSCQGVQNQIMRERINHEIDRKPRVLSHWWRLLLVASLFLTGCVVAEQPNGQHRAVWVWRY